MAIPADRPTLTAVLRLARQLHAGDQARLASHLIAALVPKLDRQPEPTRDPWATIAEIREHFRRQGPASPSIMGELIAMREERVPCISH